MECHSTNEVTIRTLGHFPPDIWGDSFSDFGVAENLRMQEYLEEIEPLKEEVRAMLIDESMDCDTKMRLIDGVERLGLYYYFDDEIVRLLDQRFEETVARNFDLDGNLYDVACQFRTFRQHGYKMPCAVFNKFTNGKGKFKESLTNDERGMVSLYEAAHLRIKGEHILDEALLFATDFLRSEKPSTEQARHALKQASHLGIPRLESFHFIAFYEEDLSHDGTLLQLAKLEFNRMQLLYRQELNQFQRWCKEREFARKLGHVRQRIVESHFWALAMYYEPQYSFARVIVAKLILVIPILDDTYDAYGTFEELQLLTDAFDRWDLSAGEKFPEAYMKSVLEFVINALDELFQEMTPRGKSHVVEFAIEEREVARGQLGSSVEWYMKSYEMSQEEATNKLRKLVQDQWKVLNEGMLTKSNPIKNNNHHLPPHVLLPIINVSRGTHAFYNVMDGYTHSSKVFKDDILATYAQPLSL